MSETPTEGCCAATVEELCAGTLQHYEEISAKAHHWSNQVPQAIKFWYLERPKLETRLRQAEADLVSVGASYETCVTAIKADLVKARDTALEDAAKVCNDIIYVPHGDGSYTGMFRHFGNQQCAAAIRAMKGK